MKVDAYAYNADHHCESCMLDYARSVEYRDYIFGEYSDSDIQHYNPGIIDVMKAVELEIIRDSEGNAIHPIFSTDEWYNIGEGTQTLACSDCGKVLDTYKEAQLMKLVFEVELQFYGETDEEKAEVYKDIAETLDRVVNLAGLSVGTFTSYRMED